MKHLLLIFVFFLVSCNPRIQPTATESFPILVIPTFTQTLTPTVEPTFIPPSPTTAPIPCDPLTADYCITDGNFIFQIPLPNVVKDIIDHTYPYASTQNRTRDPHHGVDFMAANGTPVLAAGDGTVVFAGTESTAVHVPWGDFYGNFIVIDHGNDIYTLYAHLSKINVAVDQQVKVGDVIGEVGGTGVAIGPHSHLEVRRGENGEDYFSTENPELWLIPLEGRGTLSITLKNNLNENIELPLVISYYPNGNTEAGFIYYISSYAKTFEYNEEDAVLSNLPAGQYKIAFTDAFGLHERMILIEAGKLTEVVFNSQ